MRKVVREQDVINESKIKRRAEKESGIRIQTETGLHRKTEESDGQEESNRKHATEEEEGRNRGKGEERREKEREKKNARRAEGQAHRERRAGRRLRDGAEKF